MKTFRPWNEGDLARVENALGCLRLAKEDAPGDIIFGSAIEELAELVRAVWASGEEDFPLPQACPLRNQGDDQCEACQ